MVIPNMCERGSMHTSVKPAWLGMVSWLYCTLAEMARYDSMTPFGALVVPEV